MQEPASCWGLKKTSDLLEQITWGLVISLFVLTLATSLFLDKIRQPGAFPSSPNIDHAQELGTLPDTTAPDLPTSPSNSTSED